MEYKLEMHMLAASMHDLRATINPYAYWLNKVASAYHEWVICIVMCEEYLAFLVCPQDWI